MQDVHCRMLRWTVTDIAVSPNQALMLYASIQPVVHMVRLCPRWRLYVAFTSCSSLDLQLHSSCSAQQLLKSPATRVCSCGVFECSLCWAAAA